MAKSKVITDALNRLAAAEERFLASDFLSPVICGGEVLVRIGQRTLKGGASFGPPLMPMQHSFARQRWESGSATSISFRSSGLFWRIGTRNNGSPCRRIGLIRVLRLRA
jgi:hypothetical protein